MRSKVSSANSTTPTTTPAGPAQLTKQQTNWQKNLLGWLQLHSFGGRLFWMIMLGALTGIGGMAFLFSEMIKYQAEEQVRSTLDGKVNAIASVTEAAETLAYGLGVSATTLHERKAQYPDTYRELTLQLFERRPEFVVGLGLGQRENGLVANQPWLFPYYWVNSPGENSSGRQAPVQYEDFADDDGEFYPESQRFREYFLPQKEVWTDLYTSKNNQLLTYYFPLLSSEGRWLGSTLVDIDASYLRDLLDVPVFRKQGNFILLTRSGQVIADPADADAGPQTYEDIADLKDFWYDSTFEDTGFFEGEAGYWAYASVPGQDWLVFGFVPYAAVFNRIALITLTATGLMVALLSVAISLAIRNLGRRLRPVLNQCNQLAKTDDNLLAQWDNQDDLNQLSLAFFNMLEKLNLNQETIRRHEQKIQTETLHAGQVSEQFEGFATLFSDQAEEQQMLLRHVQELGAQLTNSSQSVDIQLDALSTMGRALDGELRRVPAHSSETLVMLEQQLQELSRAINRVEHPSATQLQTLASLASQNIATLRAHDRRWPSIDSLQQQTGNITKAGEVAAEGARSMVDTSRSMTEKLTKVERIANLLTQRAKSVLSALD